GGLLSARRMGRAAGRRRRPPRRGAGGGVLPPARRLAGAAELLQPVLAGAPRAGGAGPRSPGRRGPRAAGAGGAAVKRCGHGRPSWRAAFAPRGRAAPPADRCRRRAAPWDDAGTAAVELALLAPLIVALVGMVVFLGDLGVARIRQ